jgi:proteic killer suppression protein
LDIAFRGRKLEKTFNSASALQKAYGARMAKAIMLRLAVLKTARTLAMVPTTPPDRRHQLRGDRDEQFAVDLVHPHRLVFEPNHDPLPRKDDGGIDVEQVTAITIIDVIDYH